MAGIIRRKNTPSVLAQLSPCRLEIFFSHRVKISFDVELKKILIFDHRFGFIAFLNSSIFRSLDFFVALQFLP
jgi:hypothetical protein